MQLLGFPDELLSEILKHIGVADKVQHVQRCCMRFRRLLQQPVAPSTWGSISVKLNKDRLYTAAEIKTLLQWLVLRQKGVTEVRVSIQKDDLQPKLGLRMVLYALAGALAPSHLPLLALYTQQLDIGALSALTTNALAATLRDIMLTCSDFKVQHWAVLCSLCSLRRAVLTLQHRDGALSAGQQRPITSQHMQLTNLQFLQFNSTRVEFAAPLLAHTAALTSLETLYFVNCSLGTLPEGVLKLPQLSTLGMHRCQLNQLPSLAPLKRLVRLQLPGNPALVDLRSALATKQLRWLTLGGTTPLNEATLEALRSLHHLICLMSIDISKQARSSDETAALGYLVQLTHDKGCKLLT